MNNIDMISISDIFNISDKDIRERMIHDKIEEYEENILILNNILKYNSFQEFWIDEVKNKDSFLPEISDIEIDNIDRKIIIPEYILYEEPYIGTYELRRLQMFAKYFEYIISIRKSDMGDRIANA